MIERSREFQVLAAHLNFTTAARELNESQSSLSRHISELEQMLGFRLLNRSPVQLTIAGKHYLEEMSQTIDHIDELVEECRKLARLERNEIVVSIIQSEDTASYAAYKTLADMHEVYPNFGYHMENNRKLTIEQAVEDGLADVGVIFHAPEMMPEYLSLEWIYDNPFSVLMHSNNPLADHPIHFSDVSSCTVVFSASRKLQTWVDGMRDACERYGCSPTFKMKEFENVIDCLISLRNNEVVFYSSWSEGIERYNPLLHKAQLIEEGQLFYPVYLLYRTDNANPALATFIDLFKENVAQSIKDRAVE